MKKHLQRTTNTDLSNLGTSVGDKLEIEDVMDIQDRTITFGRKKTPWEKITNDLQDKSSTTSQYVKLVNSYLTEKKSQIEKIIDLTNNFDKEIHNLKSDNNKISKLTDTPIHEFNTSDLKKLTQDLLKDRDQRRENLKKLKNELIKAEEGLYQSEKRIEKVNEQILDKQLKPKTNKKNFN